MRAVKGKNGYLSLISKAEAVMFNNVDMIGFQDVNTLEENAVHMAEEMYKKNILRKVKRGDRIGYKTYPQKEKI